MGTQRKTMADIHRMIELLDEVSNTYYRVFRAAGQRGVTILMRQEYENEVVTQYPSIKAAYDVLYENWKQGIAFQAAQETGDL
ncbi:MAG: hypothetical protein ACTSPB_15530 [Candidatus Thorarchaeota archaeon]